MPRSLTFALNDEELEAPLQRLDRRKLYGWVERKVYDRNDKECYFGAVSGDGLHVFGRESFEQGYLNREGDWLESKELTTVDQDGSPLERCESTLKQTVELRETVDEQTLLDHVIRSVYQLDAPEALLTAIREADGIYTFPFSYTASYSQDPAFLIERDGILFMLLGEPGGFEFIGLAQSASPDAEPDPEDEDAEDEDDALDFSMF